MLSGLRPVRQHDLDSLPEVGVGLLECLDAVGLPERPRLEEVAEAAERLEALPGGDAEGLLRQKEDVAAGEDHEVRPGRKAKRMKYMECT